VLAIEHQRLTLHPDRALPAEPGIRAVARRLYAQTRELPLVCMHGNVDATTFLTDEAFPDPAALLVTPDHYVTRMLVSQGASPADLGVRDAEVGGSPVDSREIWRRFCTGWKAFSGTPSRFWLEHELVEVVGMDVTPGPDTADDLYDAITRAWPSRRCGRARCCRSSASRRLPPPTRRPLTSVPITLWQPRVWSPRSCRPSGQTP